LSVYLVKLNSVTKRFFYLLNVWVCLMLPVTAFCGKDSTNTEQRLLFIPNAFTPNYDGVNDVFKIVNLENEKVEHFRVFNRWGTVMYESSGNEAAWDGTYKGKLQEQGDYGYVIIIRFPNNVTEVYKGVIHLMKN